MKGPAGRTDAAGNFTLIGFEERDYFLHASVNLAGKPVCAKKLRLNSTAPSDPVDLKLSVEGQIPASSNSDYAPRLPIRNEPRKRTLPNSDGRPINAGGILRDRGLHRHGLCR